MLWYGNDIMKDRKMIVVDLDGTLLNINKECSNKTKKYLKRLKDLGYIIVIATGRVLRSAVTVTGGAEFANYIVASAGSVIYDMDKSKIVMRNNIDIDLVKEICLSCDKEDIKCINVCDLFNHYKYITNQNYLSLCEKGISNIDNFFNESDGIVNVTIHVNNNDLIDKYYNMFNCYGLELLVMQDSFGTEKCLEIFSNGVSKYKAIEKIMMIENIDNSSVIAFGDGLNDVYMIKLCGIGVAMENALNDVKNVSDYITISHNDDGVIYFLKGYLRENNLVN